MYRKSVKWKCGWVMSAGGTLISWRQSWKQWKTLSSMLWTLIYLFIYFFNKRVFIVYTRHRRMQKSPAEWNRWQLESTIELLWSIELLEGRDGNISPFPNFVRMRERSFPAVEKLSKRSVCWSVLPAKEIKLSCLTACVIGYSYKWLWESLLMLGAHAREFL